jgi:Fe-S-cluster containining protein
MNKNINYLLTQKLMSLKYNCWKCGLCCHEIENSDNGSKKRIPLFPDEADRLMKLAEEKNITFKIIEDLVFPDILNKKIIILTWKVLMDNPEKCCPFYVPNKGCSIHKEKPLACKAFPLALERIDSFNIELSVDLLCKFVSSKYEQLKRADMDKLKEIFESEYPHVEELHKKNKKLILKIRKLEYENKIKIAREITLTDLNKALNEWERIEIKVK